MNRLLRLTPAFLFTAALAVAADKPTAPIEVVKGGTSVKTEATDKEIGITATLVTPYDIVVEWKDTVPGAGAHIIEWGTKADDEFVPLGFFPVSQTSYKHPDLMPETPSFYRVRALHGPTSNEVEIELPKDLADPEYQRRFESVEDYSWAGPETVPDNAPIEKKSIRKAESAREAAPTDLTLSLKPVTVSGFQMQWVDRSSDEEGFLIEMKPEGKDEFRVVALVEKDINKFGWTLEPPFRKAVMRVRPYYFARSSKLVTLTTGPEKPEVATGKNEPAKAPAPETKK